ncbi:unnamed protein product [Bursaphelenchus okinawaensis]|uniref:Uncharacterized protein n=1 Tax=Bursaphelenchus okinawaensis TaxID=465554 RepID=A0A811K3Z5_9BILA|nr:unnamed protein product [Bursaphelenchus okinawaensis]CAG9091287.1 unnamed protein product [Bursaphelenchus okinawaensis]
MTDVSYEIDDELGDTLTVTVCLDEDIPVEPQPRPRNFEDDLTLFNEQIGPPTKADDVEFHVDSNAHCRHIPVQAASIIELRLNPPAIGSMRNWEYLAMLLGMSMEEIVGFRRIENPMAKLLQKFANLTLNSFIRALKDTNRIDVLILLQPLINSIDTNKLALAAGADSGQFDNADTSSYNELAGPSLFPQTIPRPVLEQKAFKIPENYIFVTHHEAQDKSPESKHIRKYFRSFMANLKDIGNKNGTQILDIEDCLDIPNLYTTMMEIFSKARLILLYVSSSYFQDVHQPRSVAPPNQKTKLKKYVEELIGTESAESGNSRFMVVLTNPEDEKYRPVGWARNTIYYEFPANWNQICSKCFGGK